MAKNRHNGKPKKRKDTTHGGGAFAGGALGANMASGESAATDATV